MPDSRLELFRRRLPLKAQMGYGWLKYRFKPHPIWDEEEFIRYYTWLEKTQWWSRAELEAYQLEKLQTLVKHAYENVPYYRQLFDKKKLKPENIITLADLQKLPLLHKDDLRKNSEDFLPCNVDKSRLRYVTTSGSTGKPLGVYWDKSITVLHERAFEYRQWGWAGYRFGDRFVTLKYPPQTTRGSKKAWQEYNPAHNEIRLSIYDMTEDNLFKYVELIKKFQPKFIYAVPSAIEILARFMKRNALAAPTIKAIFCESETLYAEQRNLIESQFDCKIFSGYGMTERAADAVECELHRGYHVNMEYGIFELLDKDNQVIEKPGMPGRVVGTGLDTFYMPLLRYVTDDIAEYSPITCDCNRQATLVKNFRGRLRELIFSKSGYVVPFSAVYGPLHGPIMMKIREMKFVQEQEGDLIIHIALAPGSSQAEITDEIHKEIYNLLDENEFSVQITFVNHVSRNLRGKIGLLDQKLPVKADYLEYIGN